VKKGGGGKLLYSEKKSSNTSWPTIRREYGEMRPLLNQMQQLSDPGFYFEGGKGVLARYRREGGGIGRNREKRL